MPAVEALLDTDVLIAAIAIRLGAPLYTFNTAHFQVIPGLDVRSPYDRSR
ncbi:MAG: hypothetical protein HY713_11885 [candidate division NC10 bacterium]|nr:hypothetical protein [candidate division NC10 bacterium]